MVRAPLLAPAIAALLAILAEQHGLAVVALCTALACSCAFAFPTSARPMSSRAQSKDSQIHALRAIALALLAGYALSVLRGHPEAITTERATARYAATVTGDVRDNDSGTTSTALAIDGIGTVRATLREHVVPGERVHVRGRLEPFDEPRNPGEPSMREIERDDGFAGRLASAKLLSRAPPDAWDTRAWGARLRAMASARIRAVIPEPSATILAGALWGERGALPDDLHDAFQATGTVHILVTAGLHLGIIAALIAFALSFAGLHRTVSCAIAMAVVVAYAWFSGAHLPSERAATMIGVALLARACGARITSWNALAVAAIAVAVLWPASVGSASFALSFSCLAAIILFAEPIAHRLRALPIHDRICEALALTCATQIGTWPLTAAVFSTLAPFAIIANAIVVPLMAVVLPLGIATLALPVFAPLETFCLAVVQHVVEMIARIPGAQASIASSSAPTVIAYDALAVAAAVVLRSGHALRAALVLATACAVVVLPGAFRVSHELRITHLDVGQADAAVIQTPNGHVILIDTGGELERRGPISNAERAGKRTVLAYLRRTGIIAIDLMILTHPHGDHVGATAPIIDAMPVRMIFDSGQAYAGRAYRDAMAAAHLHKVPVVLARRGMRWTSGDGVTLDVLAPSLPLLADTGDDVNENSVVVMLRYRNYRELFMGDAGEASESRLLAADAPCHPERSRGGAEDMPCHALEADVIKVGHHGSRYASTAAFVAAVHPKIAVISVGRHNTFGHPASTTLEAWTAIRSAVLRTDRCGALSLVDGLATPMLPCTAP